ncbi:alpha/beta fold hydrolase [Novosphingobium sp. Leaf2]|uniref:alpha/beta fold hydrolase n=1 Tax=Novosphingobium sp. Leaf2 TaxID=1735670 RepID=UPI0006F34AC8|nr:alpha/beta hydrolase [Novosphingobium sp. Leaf2]KQM19045.1 alpha/beta hydrolase [Novosphingobium sp. Leaf2]
MTVRHVLKGLGTLVLALVVVLALVLLTMRLGWWNPSYESVKAAQAGSPSTFERIGTANVHIRDEGPRDGPVVIMLHSSMTNLREWDGWADALKDTYRVVRFDWPPYGLSTDTAPTTGLPGVVALLDQIAQKKGLRRFALVGTSSGATLATLYASKHPDKVTALALSALPLKAPPPPNFSRLMWAMVWMHEHLVPNYYPRFYYRRSLSELYGRPERLTDATVDWYYQTNTIPGGFSRVKAYYEANKKAVWAKGAGDDAAKVRAPILLQWGDADPVLPKYLAADAVKEFANTRVDVIHYPDVGHYPMLELPAATARDLRTWLDRKIAKPAPAAGTGASPR